jgi:SAM-dependent methyltransferase
MKEWYEIAFGELYLELYSHRNEAEARQVLGLVFDRDELQHGTVIDVACGSGRYLEELSRRGAWAMGVDLSTALLQEGHEKDPALHLVRADMRAIPLADAAVDWTLSLFTSFGYFETMQEHEALAWELARVARRGVVVDIPNPAFLQRNLVQESTRMLGERRVEERRRLLHDPNRVVKRVRIFDPNDELISEYEERVMLFSNSEFIGLFENAGLSLHSIHGDYEGAPFRKGTSPRQLARFERSGKAS